MSNSIDSNRFNRFYSLVLAVSAMVFILFPKLSSISLVLLFIVTIIGYVKSLFVFKFNKTISILALFYLVYLFGCIYTENVDQATRYLEYKLSFLFLPILFSFKLKQDLSLKLTFKFFVISLFLLQLIQLFYSFNNFINSKNINFFLSSAFSFLHHPTYFSSYLIIAIGVLMKFFRKLISKQLFIFLISYFLLGVLLSMSLSSLLLLVILSTIYTFRILYYKIKPLYFKLLVLISPLILYALLNYAPFVSEQFLASKRYVKEYVSNPKEFVSEKDFHDGGNIVRLIIWTASFYEIIDHPFGVGTGNVDIYLGKRLKDFDQDEMIAFNYNPHNQYLQTTLEIGVIGLFVLLLFFLKIFLLVIKRRDLILGLLILTLAFSSLFESMLQRQSGIVFYSFWICLLVVYSNRLNSSSKFGLEDKII